MYFHEILSKTFINMFLKLNFLIFFVTQKKMILELAHIFAITSLLLVCNWISFGNENLGGLYTINMNDKQSDNYKYVFNWHPFMMIFGMLFCLVEGILSYKTFENTYSRSTVKLIHLSWQTLCVISMIIGLVAVFFSHNYPSGETYKPNLYSLHSWIGISVVTLYFFQYLFGIYTFLTPQKISSIENRKRIAPYHVFLGIFLLFAAGFAVETGIQEKLGFGLNCSGTIPTDKADTNPAEYYNDIPVVCKKGNWLGISVFLTIFFTSWTLMEKMYPRRPLSSRYQRLDENI